jgi:hypothetical protein
LLSKRGDGTADGLKFLIGLGTDLTSPPAAAAPSAVLASIGASGAGGRLKSPTTASQHSEPCSTREFDFGHEFGYHAGAWILSKYRQGSEERHRR